VAMRRFTLLAGCLSLVGAVTLACGQAVDKHGAQVPGPVTVLHLSAADPSQPELAFFVADIAKQSNHRLRVDVDRATYFSETRGGEARLVPDLRSGRVDFAYVPTRDWAATGDPGFRALQSPFEVTTTQTAVAIAQSPVAHDLLRAMTTYNVIGLGLIPAEPRRLISRRPILAVSDLLDTRVRISDSAQTADLIEALGARPVQGITANAARVALEAADLDAVETSPLYIGENSYNVRAPYLTSFALIPKFEILAAAKRAWARLSGDDHKIVEAAAAETLAHASEHLVPDEGRELSQLCATGTVLVRPSPQALQDMADKTQSADAPDAATRQALAKMLAAVPGLGVHVFASSAPAGCPVAATAQQARALRQTSPLKASESASSPAGPSIPSGTYQVTVTKEEMAAAGQSGPDNQADIVFLWVLKDDGTFQETQRPDYPDQGPLSGRYAVRGDILTFTFDPSPTGSLSPEVVRWSFFKGTLRFTVVAVQDPGSRLIYQKPWRKTA
jgi:TRAP-type C4-dicarboxylate transport system substrate-binding protein